MIVYHGSPNQEIRPTFGLGEEKHDYGKGFYLTEHIGLAKEWAVCTPNDIGGWVHKYELDLSELTVLDFEKESILSWLAELMKHICWQISMLRSWWIILMQIVILIYDVRPY